MTAFFEKWTIIYVFIYQTPLNSFLIVEKNANSAPTGHKCRFSKNVRFVDITKNILFFKEINKRLKMHLLIWL